MAPRSWRVPWGISSAGSLQPIPAAITPFILARFRRRRPSTANPCSFSVAATARSVTEPVRLSGVSVFLPCHNEEGNIERVAAALETELPRIAERHEIVVVDDGSRD